MFKIGESYKRSEIHRKYGGREQYGISNCPEHPMIFIWTKDKKEQDVYEDKWEDGYFLYSGEGRLGDQSFTGGNKSILNHKKNNKDIFLFEKDNNRSGYWIYKNQVDLEDWYHYEHEDGDNNKRKCIRFKLKIINPNIFIFTAGDKNARKHLDDSIKNSVDSKLIFKELEGKTIAKIKSSDGNFFAWGAVYGINNYKNWKKMKKGDYILCVYDSKYRYVSKILKTIYNTKLAESIWGLNDKGKTWEYMYFMEKPIMTEIDLKSIPSKYLHPRYLGFTSISKDRIDSIDKDFDSIQGFIDYYLLNNSGKKIHKIIHDKQLDNIDLEIKNDIDSIDKKTVHYLMPQNKSTTPMNLLTIKQLNDQGRIVIDPTYQRELVWTKYKKQLLIDSIIRNFDIPKIYFVQDQEDVTKFRLVDGQQRIDALVSFMNNEFALRSDAKSYNDEDISNKKYDELPVPVLNDFMIRALDIVTLTGYSREEEKDIFHRMQLGEPLNAPERRRGIEGNCSGQIIKLAQHKVFNHDAGIIGYSIKRFANEDICAKLFHQLYNNNITPITPSAIELTYKSPENMDIDDDANSIKNIEAIFNLVYDAFNGKAIRLKKYALLRIAYLFNNLRVTYNLRNNLEEVALAYIKLEERRAINDDRIETDPDKDNKLTEYSNSARADSVSNQEYIHHHLKELFIKDADLVAKDNKRFFTNAQRQVIFRQSYNTATKKHQCQADTSKDWYDAAACIVEIDESSYEADHIDPHSNGGKTKISNGKALCSHCNSRKNSSTE